MWSQLKSSFGLRQEALEHKLQQRAILSLREGSGLLYPLLVSHWLVVGDGRGV